MSGVTDLALVDDIGATPLTTSGGVFGVPLEESLSRDGVKLSGDLHTFFAVAVVIVVADDGDGGSSCCCSGVFCFMVLVKRGLKEKKEIKKMIE